MEDLAQEIATQSWRAFPTYDPARTFSDVAVSHRAQCRDLLVARRSATAAGDWCPTKRICMTCPSIGIRSRRRHPHPARLHRLAGAPRPGAVVALPRRASQPRRSPRFSASPPPTSRPRSIDSRSACATTRRTNMELDELKASWQSPGSIASRNSPLVNRRLIARHDCAQGALAARTADHGRCGRARFVGAFFAVLAVS